MENGKRKKVKRGEDGGRREMMGGRYLEASDMRMLYSW